MKNIDEELTKLLTEVASSGKTVDISYYIPLIKALFNEGDTKPLEERRDDFIALCRPFVEVYGKPMLNAFGAYWLEIAPNGKKFRFEKEKVFDVPKRLKRWSLNQSKFSIVNMLNKKK